MKTAARTARSGLAILLLAFLMPLVAHGAVSYGKGWASSWRTADWSSTGQLDPAAADTPAMVRVYAARTGRWKGVFAVHSWIVLKEAGGRYERYDKVGWGSPIRRNAHAPDGRWYGNRPYVVYSAQGAAAERLIPKLRQAIADYPYGNRGDYRVWPGPNSNTFVAHLLARVPEAGAVLPATAVGKDFPIDDSWYGLTPSGTGVWMSAGGYAGLRAGWIEGIQLSLLGAVVGLDIRRPAVILPGFGRIGV